MLDAEFEERENEMVEQSAQSDSADAPESSLRSSFVRVRHLGKQ